MDSYINRSSNIAQVSNIIQILSSLVLKKIMSNSNTVALFIAVLLGIQVVTVYGHGYLYDPPGRSSVWRLFPQAPVNTADDAVFCGSFEVCIL